MFYHQINIDKHIWSTFYLSRKGLIEFLYIITLFEYGLATHRTLNKDNRIISVNNTNELI